MVGLEKAAATFDFEMRYSSLKSGSLTSLFDFSLRQKGRTIP